MTSRTVRRAGRPAAAGRARGRASSSPAASAASSSSFSPAAASRADTAPVSDVSDPCVAVSVPHDDSVEFVAGEMRGSGASGAGGRGGSSSAPAPAADSYFVCVVEDRRAGRGARSGRTRFVAVDNLEVLRAAKKAGAGRVGIRLVGGGERAGRGGGGKAGGADDAALREHLTRSSLHGTIDPFAAAEAAARLRDGGGGKGGGGSGGGGGAGRAYLGPYLERAVSLGFGARQRAALSDMVRRVYACGVRQAPPLPFLISVSRLGEDEQVAVADMTARLCEAVRQRHFAWPGADVIRLLLQGAGMDAGPEGEAPGATAARLPPTLRPNASSSPQASSDSLAAAAGGGPGGSRGGAPAAGAAGQAGPPAVGTSGAAAGAATESRAARMSIFYCAGCEKRYCVVKGGVREVVADRDGCYVVSPGPAGGENGGGPCGGGAAAAQPSEVIHALPSAQRRYLGLDDDSSLRVVRAGGAEALGKKAEELRERGEDGPFVVLYAADRGRRPPGRGRKRRISA